MELGQFLPFRHPWWRWILGSPHGAVDLHLELRFPVSGAEQEHLLCPGHHEYVWVSQGQHAFCKTRMEVSSPAYYGR